MPGRGTAAVTADLGDTRQTASLDCLSVEVHASARTIEAEWRALFDRTRATVYQSFEWSDCWIEAAATAQGVRPAIVALRREGRLAMLLPFGIERVGPLRVARHLGGEHANIRMPLVDPEIRLAADDGATDRLVGRIARAAGGIDLFDFDALPVGSEGAPAFLTRHSAARPARCNVGTLRLEADFAALLAAHRGSRKAKKHRWQKNALAAVGGYHLRRAETAAEARSLLDEFLREKATWFRKMGIADSFAGPGIAEFFQALVARRFASGGSVIDLDAIEFAGGVHAILGSGTAHGRQSGYFLSITDDEWRRVSPGELLIHDVVAAACARGTSLLDLGRGDERYKASWLDEIEPHVRLIIATTALGRLGAASLRLADDLERKVRNDPRLWRLLARLRRRRAAVDAEPEPMLQAAAVSGSGASPPGAASASRSRTSPPDTADNAS